MGVTRLGALIPPPPCRLGLPALFLPLPAPSPTGLPPPLRGALVPSSTQAALCGGGPRCTPPPPAASPPAASPPPLSLRPGGEEAFPPWRTELRGVRPAEGPEGAGRVAGKEGRERELVQPGSIVSRQRCLRCFHAAVAPGVLGAHQAPVAPPPWEVFFSAKAVPKLMAQTKPCLGGWVWEGGCFRMTCALEERTQERVLRGGCYSQSKDT